MCNTALQQQAAFAPRHSQEGQQSQTYHRAMLGCQVAAPAPCHATPGLIKAASICVQLQLAASWQWAALAPGMGAQKYLQLLPAAVQRVAL